MKLHFSLIGGSDYKLIYRHYATLYFVFCVDSSESELGILDLIQVFVETLDKCFENVCELDLIFHVDKVHYILNELVMGGMVLETNMNEILTRIEDQNKLEKQEVRYSKKVNKSCTFHEVEMMLLCLHRFCNVWLSGSNNSQELILY